MRSHSQTADVWASPAVNTREMLLLPDCWGPRTADSERPPCPGSPGTLAAECLAHRGACFVLGGEDVSVLRVLRLEQHAQGLVSMKSPTVRASVSVSCGTFVLGTEEGSGAQRGAGPGRGLPSREELGPPFAPRSLTARSAESGTR